MGAVAMKTYFIEYLLPALLLVSLTGCTGIDTYLDHQNNSNMNAGSAPHENIVFLGQTIPESKLKMLSKRVFKFIKINSMPMIGLLALCSMWLLARAYNAEKQCRSKKYDIQDLGLLKIAKNNLNRLWENRRPGRKVVWLRDRIN